jgi:hypothetical protein
MREDRRVELLRRFFSGVTESAFYGRLGIADPPLVDYISEMLARFIRYDEIYSVRTPFGQRLTQVADMVAEADQRHGLARRQAHRHIGDFTLFWTGLYPEMVDGMRRPGTKDSLLDYQAQGKRAYHIASTIPVEKESAPTVILQQLSEQYELCVYGLGEIRRQWEEHPGGDAPLLLE